MDNLSRKRALTNSASPGDEGYADEDTGDPLKRTKAIDEVHALRLISKEEAWQFNTAELLDSPTTIPTPNPTQIDGNNFKNYDSSKSIFVLCVLGNLSLQLDLLCACSLAISQLSPHLQALVLTRSPQSISSIVETSPISLPIVEAQGNPASHFLKLGLLHPLGGGDQPLDAIVVIDTDGKRRLVLPFGWGAGRHIGDPVTGGVVQQRFKDVLQGSIRALEREKSDRSKDFYDIARTYF